jgi:hypothetical protein
MRVAASKRIITEVGLVSAALACSRTEAHTMEAKTREDWMYFCEQAAVEQDPEKLLQLVKEINRMLEEKENRLRRRGQK